MEHLKSIAALAPLTETGSDLVWGAFWAPGFFKGLQGILMKSILRTTGLPEGDFQPLLQRHSHTQLHRPALSGALLCVDCLPQWAVPARPIFCACLTA